MLLENADNRPAISKMVENNMRSGNPVKQPEKIYGLEKYTRPPRGQSSYKPDDTFIEKDHSGEIVSLLRCSPPGKDKIPGYRHKFIDKGLLYSISWPIRDLPEWHKQREAAISFIDGLEISD